MKLPSGLVTQSMSFARIEPDLRRRDREEQVPARAEIADADPLSLQGTDSYANGSKHPACKPATAVIGTPRSRQTTNVPRKEAIAASDYLSLLQNSPHGHMPDIGEAFSQQLFANVPGRNAHTGITAQPDRGRLQRPLV
jgi:hypothetical protein